MGVGLVVHILRLRVDSGVKLPRSCTAPVLGISLREESHHQDQGPGKEEEKVPQRSGERFVVLMGCAHVILVFSGLMVEIGCDFRWAHWIG